MVALLDEAQRLGILGEVSDEGDFWETRSLERLTKEIGAYAYGIEVTYRKRGRCYKKPLLTV